MSISCKFHLTRSSHIYYCGERIEGSLTLCSLKLRQVEAISLQFCGQTQVAWWDLDKTAVANSIVHNDFSTQEVWQKTLFSNRQKHVCDQLELDNSTQWLQPHVEYGYQFCFLIPQHVPATSRCPPGECEYVLRLVLQHTKKANKEFLQRITVKRKLDLSRNLTYKEPCSVTQRNQFGQLVLSTPCTGFTPGQRVPYLLNFQAAQMMNRKVLIQLNCFIRCRSQTPSDSEKLIKQIIKFKKHRGCGKIWAHLTLPLDSHISKPPAKSVENLILLYEYMLEALVVDGSKKILLAVAIPLTIGSTPCFKSSPEDSDENGCMGYDNYGSPHGASIVKSLDLAMMTNCSTDVHQICESMGLLPLKPTTTNLRRSLRYCYKKISKIV